MLAQSAEIQGEGNPQRHHHNQCIAHQGFVNQNFGAADKQNQQGLWRVDEMDPFGIGFHGSHDTTERGEELVS